VPNLALKTGTNPSNAFQETPPSATLLTVFDGIFTVRKRNTVTWLSPTFRPVRQSRVASRLYLLVNQTGKYWRLDYKIAGKRKTLALGVYDEIGLREARDRRDDARSLLAKGIDPSVGRKLARRTTR